MNVILTGSTGFAGSLCHVVRRAPGSSQSDLTFCATNLRTAHAFAPLS